MRLATSVLAYPEHGQSGSKAVIDEPNQRYVLCCQDVV